MEIGGSCQTCPSNAPLANLIPLIALTTLVLLGTLVYLFTMKRPNRVPKFKFNLKRMIQIKQLGGEERRGRILGASMCSADAYIPKISAAIFDTASNAVNRTRFATRFARRSRIPSAPGVRESLPAPCRVVREHGRNLRRPLSANRIELVCTTWYEEISRGDFYFVR